MAKKTKALMGDGYTATLSDVGFLGYVNYDVTRNSDGKRVGGGGISRDNFPKGKKGDHAHLDEINRAFIRVIEEDKAALAKAKPEAAPKRFSMVVDGEPAEFVDLAQLVADNSSDEELTGAVDRITTLAVGESINLGGGAAPLITIKRVA